MFPGRLGTDPRRPIRIAGCDHEKWVVQTFGRLTRNFGILAEYPAAITRAGEGERPTKNPARQGPGGGMGEVDLINFN